TLFLDGFITEEEFKNKNDALELELIEKIRIQENLNNTKNINVKDISSYVKKLADALDSQNISIKKQFLQTFVEEIIIYKETINIKLKFFGLVDRDTIGGSGGQRFLSLSTIYRRYFAYYDSKYNPYSYFSKPNIFKLAS
ncbi:hypothetical protein, partial [Sebaldella sp. S0638]|uniref:hypothetical protein n=1 Tax=Sebaldella sp. S0638 TaxID=2957809 RepID=UPI0020A0E687